MDQVIDIEKEFNFVKKKVEEFGLQSKSFESESRGLEQEKTFMIQ